MPFGAPFHTVPKSGCSPVAALPHAAMSVAEFGSTGSPDTSRFHALSAGNGRLPCRLAFAPRAGTPAVPPPVPPPLPPVLPPLFPPVPSPGAEGLPPEQAASGASRALEHTRSMMRIEEISGGKMPLKWRLQRHTLRLRGVRSRGTVRHEDDHRRAARVCGKHPGRATAVPPAVIRAGAAMFSRARGFSGDGSRSGRIGRDEQIAANDQFSGRSAGGENRWRRRYVVVTVTLWTILPLRTMA